MDRNNGTKATYSGSIAYEEPVGQPRKMDSTDIVLSNDKIRVKSWLKTNSWSNKKEKWKEKVFT